MPVGRCLALRRPIDFAIDKFNSEWSIELTHSYRMEFRTVINLNSPFLFEGMLGGIFHVYSNFKINYCEQTVENLIRRRVLRCLIWFCTVCLCPTERTLGLIIYWLSNERNSRGLRFKRSTRLFQITHFHAWSFSHFRSFVRGNAKHFT